MNATIIKGERSKLLAVAVVIAMVACALVAFVPTSDAADEEPITYTDITAEKFLDSATDGVITLKDNYSLTTALSIDGTLTINLNGHALVNDTTNPNHTITVSSTGNLTITGSGNVDNITHAKAAIWNDGTVVLSGGEYTRSLENGINSEDNGGNSYYNIVNHGTMTIQEGVTVSQNGAYSSMVENGWYNGSQNTGGQNSVMIIEGGTFTGGLNTIKNDDYGVLTITGGTFSNVVQAAVLNWNVATIEGGAFTSSETVILNGYLNDTMDRGTLTVTGGKFTAGQGHYAIEPMINGNSSFGDISIDGGEFVSTNDVPFGILYSSEQPVAGWSGSVSFEENSVEVSGFLTTSGKSVEFSQGSVRISGTITADATITADGDVLIDGVVVSGKGSGITIETVDDGTSTITISDLTVGEGATLDIQTDVTIEKLENNGTINVADNTKVDGADKISGTGIRYEDGGSTAYVNTYDDLDQVVRNELEVTKVYLMSSVSAPSTTGITRPDATSTEQTVTIYLGDGSAPVTLDMAGAILNLQYVIVDVPAGSQLTVSNAIKYAGLDHIVTHQDSKIDVQGATLFVADGSFTVGKPEGDTIKYLNMEEGTLFRYSNAWFTIYHGETTSDMDVQYGFALNVAYNGISHAGNVNGFHAVPFDNYFSAGNQTSGEILSYNSDDLTAQEKLDLGDVSGIVFSDDESCTSAGYYVVRTTLSITAPEGDVVPFSDVSVFRISPADSQAVFDGIGTGENKTPTVTPNPEDPTQIMISGEVQFDGENYYVDVTFKGKEYDNGILTDVTDYTGRLVSVDGVEVDVTNGTIRLPIDKLTGTTPVEVVYDADGDKGTNYNPTTYTITFSNLKASADVGFVGFTDDNLSNIEGIDDLYGKMPSDLQDNITFIANGEDSYIIDGSVNWVSGYTKFWEGDSDEAKTNQRGYYVAFYLKLPAGFDNWNGVYVTDGSKTSTGAVGDVFDGYYVYRVLDADRTISITVDLDGLSGDVYEGVTYTLTLKGTVGEGDEAVDYGLDYMPSADYIDEVDGPSQTIEGIALSDVADRTIYMIFDSYGIEATPQITLYYGDVEDAIRNGQEIPDTVQRMNPVFTNSGSDVYIWYASFDDELKDFPFGGVYTIQAVIDGQTVAVDTVNVPVVYGYGYDESASNVITDVSVATGGEIVLPSDGVDGVAPETMWIAWYTAAQTTGATATLTWNGHEIFNETLDVWNEVNPHVWYFSFDKDNASFIGNKKVDVDGTGYWSDYESIRPGVYVMTVVDEKNNTLATGEIVIDGYADAHYEELADDALKGMKFDGVDTSGMVADTPTGVAPETMWIAWYNSSEVTGISATLEWNGQVIFTETDDTATFAPGSHVWYFTFDKTNENFIGKDNDSWPWTDAEYTGIVGGEYKLTVRDAAGNLLAEGEYTHYDPDTYYIGFDEEGTEYDIVDLPLDHGYAIQMPGSAIEGMTVKYWNMVVDGEVVRTYNPGSMFVVGVSSPAKIITFVAVYNEPASEHTIQYWIAAALENAGYGFAASYVIDGGDVVAVYSDSEYGTAVMMNDFARYMGALYRVSEGDIVSVYFNGTEYVWKAEVGLDGSNWVEVDADGDIVTSADSEGEVRPNTLVRAVTEYFQADELYKNSIALELTNAAGDKAVLNYGLGIEDPASSDGYAKVRQLDDYYAEVTVENGDIHIVLKVVDGKIDGYRNVLTTLNLSYRMWFNDSVSGSTTWYIDEPDKDGVVAEYTFSGVLNESGSYRITVSGFVGNGLYTFYSQDSTVQDSDVGTETNTAISNKNE